MIYEFYHSVCSNRTLSSHHTCLNVSKIFILHSRFHGLQFAGVSVMAMTVVLFACNVTIAVTVTVTYITYVHRE